MFIDAGIAITPKEQKDGVQIFITLVMPRYFGLSMRALSALL
jgi:hypothetical protein